MEIGKRICKTLKELRKRIADANEIPFETDECTHKGECLGTCPKCEDEVSYLMDSMEKREQEGKPVVIEGLMTDDELRQAFLIDSTDGMDDEDIIMCREQRDCLLWEMCQIEQYQLRKKELYHNRKEMLILLK